MGLQEQIAPIDDADGGTCITVGTFDGVHNGHQALLRRVVEIAEQYDNQSVALSFRRPPRSVIDPTRQTKQLYGTKTRVSLIQEQGIDTVRLIDFDDEIRVMSAEAFLTTLQNALGMTHLVIGESAVLGHDLLNIEQLDEIARSNGFRLHTVPPVRQNDDGTDIVVSSSTIRAALAQGDVKRTAAMLGRLYERGGKVTHGAARAREMGVPTANMKSSPDLVMPAHGIYATWAKLPDGRILPSGTYIGDNPTFERGQFSFEVHISDFDEVLYGQYVSVEFIDFIRPDEAFDTVEELEQQIQLDVQRINQIFESLPPRTT